MKKKKIESNREEYFNKTKIEIIFKSIMVIDLQTSDRLLIVTFLIFH